MYELVELQIKEVLDRIYETENKIDELGNFGNIPLLNRLEQMKLFKELELDYYLYENLHALLRTYCNNNNIVHPSMPLKILF